MKIYFFSFIIFLFSLNQAFATWSIIAVDPKTGEIGSAGASWSPGVWMIVHPVPGKGMVVAQAATNIAAGQLAASLLLKGEKPEAIIQKITQPEWDPKWKEQQYGIVSLDGTVATFTGIECSFWAGSLFEHGVSVQGNLLVCSEVVKATLSAYIAALKANKSMAERLLLAMEAGAAFGGDIRAKQEGWETGLTAYLVVSKVTDAARRPGFALVAYPPARGGNPVTELRKQFNSLVSEQGILPEHPLYFPENQMLWGLYLVIPLFLGLLLSFLFRAWKALLVSMLSTLTLYSILLFITSRMDWVISFNDFLAWAIPLFLAVVTIILSAIILWIRSITARHWSL